MGMRIRRPLIVISATLAVIATASIAEGQDQLSKTATAATATETNFATAAPGIIPKSAGSPSEPSGEQTHPYVQPSRGGRLTTFTLTFTLREAPGHQGILAEDYSVQVNPPQGVATSCAPPQLPPIESGAAGALEHAVLPPPTDGWCSGAYRVTVYLQRGPYCPPPAAGQQPNPCPEFALQEVDTGTAGFTVGDGGLRRSARIIGEVRACSAPGHCLRRAFHVSAIDPSGEIIARSTSHGADNRYRLLVPPGHYSLQATSSGLSCRGSATARAHRTLGADITCMVP